MSALEERVKARIRAEGPMRFDRFMEMALNDPEHGYYARGPRIGPEGDFSTSVRFAAFRDAILRLAEAAHDALGRPEDFRIVELGAGTGQLARHVIEGWARGPIEYRTVDASAALRARQAEAGARPAARLQDVEPGPALVFGNEVLDALPVRRIVGGPAGPLEIHVDLDRAGRLRDRVLPGGDADAVEHLARLGVTPQRGQICDVALGLASFVRDAARIASPGFLVFIDYGDPAPRLYDAQRINGTLAAYRAHGKFQDVYAHVGEQDLTADVDWTTVARAATEAGMEELGLATQQELLEALGVTDFELTSPARLGSAFQAAAFRRGTTTTLPGF